MIRAKVDYCKVQEKEGEMGKKSHKEEQACYKTNWEVQGQ